MVSNIIFVSVAMALCLLGIALGRDHPQQSQWICPRASGIGI